MNTKIVQKCGCYEGDCVEILGLEFPLYACFTCGYAGVTPSGADDPHEDEVHVHNLFAEVKRWQPITQGCDLARLKQQKQMLLAMIWEDHDHELWGLVNLLDALQDLLEGEGVIA